MQSKLACLVFQAAVLMFVGVTGLSADQNSTIRVSVGEAVIVPAENVSKLAVADPTIADVAPLSNSEISLIGKNVGVTSLTIVRDGAPTTVHRVEVENQAAAQTVRQMIGQPGISVRAIGDTLVLDGQVDDELQATRALQIAQAYQEKVVNLLEIREPNQIKISMRIAEVNTEAAKRIGIQYFGPEGEVRYGFGRVIQSEPSPAPGDPDTFSGHGFLNSDTTSITPGNIPIGVEAKLRLLETKNLGRILSEPTLITLSGEEASFLVGEERPIVQQLQNTFTVEFKEVGVRMKVTPTADSRGRIRTDILAEVSQVTGIVGSQSIPVIGTKKSETVLIINDGETFVLGGLLENNLSKDTLRKVPWLGDIPIFGYLFRDKETSAAQKEVLFFVTVEIVKDPATEVASAARSPWMKKWNGEANDNILEVKQDWAEKFEEGLHKPLVEPATEKPAPPPQPIEPKKNFVPARPANKD